MPGSYRILPAHGLVYVQYEGFASLDDARGLYEAYMLDPARTPEQKQLIDLSKIDDWERDFVGLMQFQADAAAGLFVPDRSMMMVIHAAPGPSMRLARHFTDAWSQVPGMVVTLQTDEAAALSILGVREQSIPELLHSIA
ncbi:MAG: hypothetical protein VX874_18225 [Pseudomonadota bacterium]|nr:hypothetical protein [Pseudomonadota bacterium]